MVPQQALAQHATAVQAVQQAFAPRPQIGVALINGRFVPYSTNPNVHFY
jgi:hypothetical protein